MNTAAIIRSKKKLEEQISALVKEYKGKHNLTNIEVNTRVRRFDAGFMIKTEVDTVVTATINEGGSEIIIK